MLIFALTCTLLVHLCAGKWLVVRECYNLSGRCNLHPFRSKNCSQSYTEYRPMPCKIAIIEQRRHYVYASFDRTGENLPSEAACQKSPKGTFKKIAAVIAVLRTTIT